jgi:hypothetical protein
MMMHRFVMSVVVVVVMMLSPHVLSHGETRHDEQEYGRQKEFFHVCYFNIGKKCFFSGNLR